MRKKISLIGAGNIGGTIAHLIALKGVADVVLFDIVEGMPQGKALDISQSSCIEGFKVNVMGTNSYSDIKNSDVIIVTAGITRKPGMSRSDLLETNTEVIRDVANGIRKYSPQAFVIVITNPLDAIVWVTQQLSELPTNMVVGMAGILDASRYNYFLSQELKVSVNNVSSIVLGGHGDLMVPLPSYTNISGIPLQLFIHQGLISQNRVNKIIERTRKGGEEIVRLLQKGSAFFAPASSAVAMATAYLLDEKVIFPCAAYLDGEYGEKDIYAGVPVVIGSDGVERIIELELSDEEKESFAKSVNSVKSLINEVKL